MKILCVADHIDPLVYSSSVKSRFGDVDLVLSAGDLPMDYIGFIASSLNKPVGFVFGNHNLKELPTFSRSARPLLDSTSIHSQIRNQFGATYLEDLTGLTQMHKETEAALEAVEMFDEDEDELDD